MICTRGHVCSSCNLQSVVLHAAAYPPFFCRPILPPSGLWALLVGGFWCIVYRCFCSLSGAIWGFKPWVCSILQKQYGTSRTTIIIDFYIQSHWNLYSNQNHISSSRKWLVQSVSINWSDCKPVNNGKITNSKPFIDGKD